MSFFKMLSTLPEDPIFSLIEMFKKNQNPQKINLGIGVYKDSQGVSVPFKSIKKAEKELLEKNLGKEYLPIDGDPLFIKSLLQLIFGEQGDGKMHPNIYAAQSVGGTNALRLGAELINRELSRLVFIPEISWSNHSTIFRSSGMNVKTYSYSINDKGVLDFEKTCESFEKMPPGSLVLLHGCCHNPTGVDFSLEQWKELSARIKKRSLLPFFDFAYHGFGNDLDEDAAGIRYFHSQGHEMMIAYSCSKNFGMYGERLGMLVIVTNDHDPANVASQIKSIIRTDYSNPPLHGSRIVSAVLQSKELADGWKAELQEIRERCLAMRHQLAKALEKSKRDFSFLSNQRGLFSLTGLTKVEVIQLREQYGVIMPESGRINIAALTEKNMEYASQAILNVLCPKS